VEKERAESLMAKKGKKIQSPETFTPIGKEYLDRASRPTDDTVAVGDLSRSMSSDYMKNLVDTALKARGSYSERYYIVVLTKVERLIGTAIRNYFVARQSCPTPNYGQTVYSFDPKDESFELLWLVPIKKVCDKMYSDRFNVELINDPLINYVVDYIEGRLLGLCMKLNKEV